MTCSSLCLRVRRRSRRTFSTDFQIFRRHFDGVVIYFSISTKIFRGIEILSQFFAYCFYFPSKLMSVFFNQYSTLWVKKDQRYFPVITWPNVGRFSFFHHWIQQEICNKTLVIFPPNLNCVATLPCKTWNATVMTLPLQLWQKLVSKFIHLLLNVIYIIWHIHYYRNILLA